MMLLTHNACPSLLPVPEVGPELQLSHSEPPRTTWKPPPQTEPSPGQGPHTSLSYPMAIMSASFVSPVLRCNSDVTSLGGMAVPTFQVTTVMLRRNKGE